MKSIIWGVFLIVLGSLLLYERLGGAHVPVGSLWPLILFAIAATHFADRRIGSAVMYTLLGAVFLSCTMGWYGMSYHHSWPLLLVAVGTGIVVRAFTGEESCRWKNGEVRHG